MEDKEYFSLKALSKSQVRKYRSDFPMEFWNSSVFNPKMEEVEQTDAMAFGKLLHCLLLEPKMVKSNFTVCDDYGKSRINKKWKEAQSKTDKTIISQAELDKATKMIKAIFEYELYRDLLDGVQTERAYTWDDKELNIACKMKLDGIKNTKDGIIVFEYKTTGMMDSILWSIDKGTFQIDTGFYDRGVEKKYGKRPIKVIFLFQSTKAGEEHKIKVMSIEGPTLDSCRVAVDLSVKEIKGRLDRWEKKDPTAWLSVPEITLWDKFSLKFDENLAEMGEEQ